MPNSIAVADVNADGKPDLLTANQGNDTAGVLVGNGNGTYQTLVTYSTGTYSAPYSIAVADVNADGKPDVLTANLGSNTVSILLNTTTVLAARFPTASTAFSLVPNPATTEVVLTAANLPALAHDVEATLLNSLGQLVNQTTLPISQGTARATLSTAGLPAGIYLLHLRARDAQSQAVGTLATQRLLIH